MSKQLQQLLQLSILIYDSATALPPILQLACNITIQLLKTGIKLHFGIPIDATQMMGSPSSCLRCVKFSLKAGWLSVISWQVLRLRESYLINYIAAIVFTQKFLLPGDHQFVEWQMMMCLLLFSSKVALSSSLLQVDESWCQYFYSHGLTALMIMHHKAV